MGFRQAVCRFSQEHDSLFGNGEHPLEWLYMHLVVAFSKQSLILVHHGRPLFRHEKCLLAQINMIVQVLIQ